MESERMRMGRRGLPCHLFIGGHWELEDVHSELSDGQKSKTLAWITHV
jgi:hypothetical protein